MKKHLKKIAVAMVIAASLFTWSTAYSTVVPVKGCRYTGNYSDYCNAGGVYVLGCCNNATATDCGVNR